MNILLTGGAGFVGHHFVEHFLKHTDWHIYIIDKLTYAGSLKRLADIEAWDERRVTLFSADFAHSLAHLRKELPKDIAVVIHMGGETHVDRSITDPVSFVEANVLGTAHVLNLARSLESDFYFFSTDEVFGPCLSGAFTEGEVHTPKNPYAATKSGAEQLVTAYANTYRMPCVITRSMNIFGERQHAEKFIPLCIRSILNNETIPIHADASKLRAGSRFYIHARNVADGYWFLLRNAINNGTYHITGSQEVSNSVLAEKIGYLLGKTPRLEFVDFHSSRPGHDLRYALSGERMEKLGWRPPKDFHESLEKTVNWYLNNREWLENRTPLPAAAAAG